MTLQNPPVTEKAFPRLSASAQRHFFLLFGISSLILLVCSSVRHALFQSGAFDLGIFDQFAYLISRGLPPISSFIGHHQMGDHAAYSFYPIAIFYRIWADVHWLFLIQAVALASGIFPIGQLALRAGLSESKALLLGYVYLLYPLIFNVNLFDFHPEVMALPCILWAVLFARQDRYFPFLGCIVFILGCKAVLSLTVLAMGVWLVIFERKKACGTTAIALGLIWFVIATQVVIPYFRGGEAAAVGRYDEFGDSVLAIAINVLKNPLLVARRLFTLPNLEYLIYLFIPLGWAIVPRYCAPLIGAAPILFINLITDYYPQKNLTQQYSVPILPFLILVAIATLAANKSWIKHRRIILIWSIVFFIALGKYGYFWSRYLRSLDTLEAMRTAVSYVESTGSVLTTHAIAPHLTHRPVVRLISPAVLDSGELNTFDYVITNMRHPGWENSVEVSEALRAQLETTQEFTEAFEQDGVYLFVRQPN